MSFVVGLKAALNDLYVSSRTNKFIVAWNLVRKIEDFRHRNLLFYIIFAQPIWLTRRF